MKWLNEYKEQRGDIGYGKPRGAWANVEIDLDDFDRMVEIIEKSEWSWRFLDKRGCQICGKTSTSGHKKSCPYHEEWKP